MTATALPVDVETHARIAALEQQITDLTGRLAVAEHAATHDPLTGLLNRAGLEERWRTPYANWSIALIDLTNFKQVNDTYGHDCGDEVLRQTAIRLAEYVGGDDIAYGLDHVARVGGDEFVIGLADLEEARELIRRLELPVLIGPDPLEVYPAAAIGLAFGRDLYETMRLADVAMRRAKRQGGVGSAVVAYDPAVHGVPERQDRPARRRRDAQRPATRADVWQAQLMPCGHLPGDVCGCTEQAARDRIELAHAPVIRMGGAA